MRGAHVARFNTSKGPRFKVLDGTNTQVGPEMGYSMRGAAEAFATGYDTAMEQAAAIISLALGEISELGGK
jgi:hypothetical protein